MNKTTLEALKLAEEALTGLTKNDSVNAYFADKRNKALAAIRDALADHVEQNLTMVADHSGGANEMVAEPAIPEWVDVDDYEEPVKQEPVAWIALALEALIYHTQQTRPIQKTDEAIIYLQNLLNKQEQNMTFTLEDAIKKFPEIAYWHSEFEKHNTVTAPVDAKAIRADALEEAAKMAEAYVARSIGIEMAAAIRCLK